jgi:hypothetical protein
MLNLVKSPLPDYTQQEAGLSIPSAGGLGDGKAREIEYGILHGPH